MYNVYILMNVINFTKIYVYNNGEYKKPKTHLTNLIVLVLNH